MAATEPTAVAARTGASPSRSEAWLPILLSAVAGMVDVIGCLTLGVFTAHVTGNIVVIGALLVRHNHVNPVQLLALPVFIAAVAATWLAAKALRRRCIGLMRPLLLIHFLLITCVLIFTVMTKHPADSGGLMPTITAMIAVSAMGCQFALLRLNLPEAPSTAVMTGNLTNAVLALVDSTSQTPLMRNDNQRLSRSLHLLAGFFVGCVMAAAAVAHLGAWAWSLPVALSAAAVALPSNTFVGAR